MCGRGTHEKVYGELKGGFAFDCLPTDNAITPTAAWQVFSIIAFNLMRAMQGPVPRSGARRIGKPTAAMSAVVRPSVKP